MDSRERIQAHDVFANAIAAWHMADLKESTGRMPDLAIIGDAEVGVRLDGKDRQSSLAQGSDGCVAELRGGWLELTQQNENRLGISDVFSVLVRFHAGEAGLMGSLLAQKSSPAEASFDLSMWDFMPWRLRNLAFTMESLPDKKAFIKVVNLHLNDADPDQWHDVLVRSDGEVLELFWDGVLRDRRPVAVTPTLPRSRIHLMRSYTEMFLHADECTYIGADPFGKRPFRGLIDHVVVWDSVLSDSEVAILSGGRADATWHGRKDAWIILDGNGERNDARTVAPGIFPAQIGEEERLDLLDEKLPELLGEMLENDPYFPKFHVALPGYIYNTHAVYHRGMWHLFPMWEGDVNYCGWFGLNRLFLAHLASADLVHWEIMPFPIRQMEPKGTHICNASFIPDGDRVIAFYLSYIRDNAPWLAVSTDPDLASWQMPQRQPILLSDDQYVGRLDPTVFHHGDYWYLTGARYNKARGQADFPLYRSTDLTNWDFRGTLLELDIPGRIHECAQMIRLGDQYMLTHGTSGPGVYMAGDSSWHPEDEFLLTHGGIMDQASHQYLLGYFQDERFIPVTGGRWDYGSEPRYISHTAIEANGRAVNWFTVPLHAEEDARATSAIGWKGMHTLPREIYRKPDGTLAFRPAPELESLRRTHSRLADIEITPDSPAAVPDAAGAQLEVSAVIEQGNAEKLGVAFVDGAQQYLVIYDAASRCLCLDLTRSSLYGTTAGKVFKTPELTSGGIVSFRVFYDASIIEVFVDGHAITVPIRPSHPENIQVRAFSEGGQAKIRSLDVWKLGSIWN